MKVRILSAGWESFTGSLGFQAVFKDGVSVDDLNPRQVARIGSNLRIVDVETGEQVGPSVVKLAVQSADAPVLKLLPRADEVEAKEAVADEVAREVLIAEEKARKDADAKALAEAQEKQESSSDDLVIYSRQELEAIAANDGIDGLRAIAKPLGVKARSITDMVDSILKAQTKAVAN